MAALEISVPQGFTVSRAPRGPHRVPRVPTVLVMAMLTLLTVYHVHTGSSVGTITSQLLQVRYTTLYNILFNQGHVDMRNFCVHYLFYHVHAQFMKSVYD